MFHYYAQSETQLNIIYIHLFVLLYVQNDIELILLYCYFRIHNIY